MERDLRIFAEQVEPEALHRIYELSKYMPFWGERIRVMPDVHLGAGCVVGFTATSNGLFMPSVIGGDMGCGMLTVPLGKKRPDLDALDQLIRERVPAGSRVHKAYGKSDCIEALRCFGALREIGKLYRSVGTLGGGNHFIEVDADSEGRYYLVIHTGSRNLGQQVAAIYRKRAVKECRDSEWIPPEFCYLQGDSARDYLHDLEVCTEFARQNRFAIARCICTRLGVSEREGFDTVHNYVDSQGVIRKGAICADKGKKVLIPLNMRDGCLVAVGKGNDDWNRSAPHGAGRLYSRKRVRELFSVAEFQREMAGIYTSSLGEDTLDESPMAYKDGEEIRSLIAPTVDVTSVLRPVYNFKAGKAGAEK